jgi:4-hydroxy-tetrahydrodipicolinate reductase
MKIALLGKGKTGSKVLEVVAHGVTVFDSTHRPTAEELGQHDVIISFLPGEAFAELIPMLLKCKRPVVTGSTGFSWPDNFDQSLREKKLTWIYSSNFSLGIVIIKQLIERLNQVSHLLENKHLSIHEVHHTRKLDAPSGTALSMKGWLDGNPDMTYERTGDVVGLHELKIETASEVILLSHEAKNRQLFAEGAVWAARHVLNKNIEPGLHAFQKVVEDHLRL